MEIMSSIYSCLYTIPYVLVVFLYVLLSPLCIISSSLFEAALQLTIDIDDQTALLILILIIVWSISAFFIFDIIKNRTYKSLFFYEFVFYLTAFNFILIGITYSLLRRENLLEEVLAKIFTTLLMIWIAENLKRKGRDRRALECSICFDVIERDEIVLNCKHMFHENCLWNWFYVRSVCPTCLKSHPG
jgi:hypothetical protein